jgi:predicted dehydrogenase
MIDLVMVGAGSRGGGLARQVREGDGRATFTAVAEPDAARREKFAKAWDIPKERQFNGWEELCEQPRLADAAINATMDEIHVDSALALMKSGYDMILEKPLALSPLECLRLLDAQHQSGCKIAIGHVLRHAPVYELIHRCIHEGRLGKILTVRHVEHVGFWHMAHSFVRGNWGRSDISPILLAKCCHDLDLIAWLMGEKCTKISSFGSLRLFCQDNAPEGAPLRCTDGCPAEETCEYSAIRQYLGENVAWPVSAISMTDTSLTARKKALEEGPYGRCVFRADNDVCDQQVVNMEFESGSTVAFTMNGTGAVLDRETYIAGSSADLTCSLVNGTVTVRNYRDGSVEELKPTEARDGHGGGDSGLMEHFLDVLINDEADFRTGLATSVDSHLLVFAAEESRNNGCTVDIAEYRSNLEKTTAK